MGLVMKVLNIKASKTTAMKAPKTPTLPSTVLL